MMTYVVIGVLFKIGYATEHINASSTLLQLPNLYLEQLLYIEYFFEVQAYI